MHIQELILDGFKSYPVRTQITGWDPSFNAITGLNGSGKSNILDAICFVLGLTNLTSVSGVVLELKGREALAQGQGGKLEAVVDARGVYLQMLTVCPHICCRCAPKTNRT